MSGGEAKQSMCLCYQRSRLHQRSSLPSFPFLLHPLHDLQPFSFAVLVPSTRQLFNNGGYVHCIGEIALGFCARLSQLFPHSIDEAADANTEKVVRVQLPAVSNKWVKRGEERCSQTIMLMSGVSSSAGDGVKVLIDPNSQQQTQVTMDISNSLMFNAEEYLKQFTVKKNGVDQPRFGEFSSKLTAMDVAVAKQFKGDSAHNKVKAVHYQHSAGVTVQKEPHKDEVGSGVKVMQIGKARNPENICHIELTAGESAFHSPDAKEAFFKKDKKVKNKKNK